MSKKIFWKNNTTPPTNHIWCKTDREGNVLGVHEYNGDTWVPVQKPSGDGVPNTIAMRSDKGNLKTGTPIDNDNCIPLSSFSWIYV